MARMTASASSDPLDPLPFRAGDAAGAEPGVEGGPAKAGVSSPAARGARATAVAEGCGIRARSGHARSGAGARRCSPPSRRRWTGWAPWTRPGCGT